MQLPDVPVEEYRCLITTEQKSFAYFTKFILFSYPGFDKAYCYLHLDIKIVEIH